MTKGKYIFFHFDLHFCKLALKELKSHKRTDLCCHHIAFLTSEIHLKKVFFCIVRATKKRLFIINYFYSITMFIKKKCFGQ